MEDNQLSHPVMRPQYSHGSPALTRAPRCGLVGRARRLYDPVRHPDLKGKVQAVPTRKHLVLEDDVYEALLGRKDLTGLPISRIGNSILRGHIAAVLLEDLVGKRLVENGRISQDEYREVLREATTELRRSFQPGRAPIEASADGRMVSGSWEIENLLRSGDGSFQILECWARDSLQQPMGQHFHDADEYVIALNGRSFFVMGGLPFTLTKGNMLQVPSGAVHSAIPLSADCHLLAVTVPATAEYSVTSK